MRQLLLLTFCTLLNVVSVFCNNGKCEVVCQKKNKIKKDINFEIFLEYKKAVIRIPESTNYVEENRMLTLSNGEIMPEVSMRLPSLFTVDPVAGNHGNCGPKFSSQIKELRKRIRCSPRPIIVDVVSNEGRVIPTKVLTKQCSGLCGGTKICTPVKTENISYPVQILISDGGIRCSTILIPADKKCRCRCAITKENCTSKQKFEQKSCSCKCKNEVERDHCIRKSAKTQTHLWDHKTCSCVCKNETPCTTGTFWDKTRCRCSKESENG